MNRARIIGWEYNFNPDDNNELIDAFVHDDDFRSRVIKAMEVQYPENMAMLWDIADNINLQDSEYLDRTCGIIRNRSIQIGFPGTKRTVQIILPLDMLEEHIKLFHLSSRIDHGLRDSIRKNIPENLDRIFEAYFRRYDFHPINIAFFKSFIERTHPNSDKFIEALKLFEVLCPRTIKFDFQEILQNERQKEIDDIDKYKRYYETLNKTEEGGSSIDYERDVIVGGFRPPNVNLRKSIKNIELIDYILGLDEETIPKLFSETVFEVGRTITPRSKRIRNIRDYLEMYFRIYPFSKNKRKTAEMALITLNKLYMFLNEYSLALRKLTATLDIINSIYEKDFLVYRFMKLSVIKSELIEAFYEGYYFYIDKNYDEAIKTSAKAVGYCNAELSQGIYPTTFNRDITDAVREQINRPEIQNILVRMHEIDFDSSRLIEFMSTILTNHGQGYSILRYPYELNLQEMLGFESEDNPWSRLKEVLADEEGINAENVSIKSPEKPIIINIVAFWNLLDIAINELRKNSISYARPHPTTQILEGTIIEECTVTREGLVYTIEDNNEGIAPQRLQLIFNVCFSKKGEHFKSFSGIGIGLAQVRNIVDMYGGTIEVYSRISGENPYSLSYQDGVFSEPLEIIRTKDHPLNLQNPTGTKIRILIPYHAFPTMGFERIIAPPDERGEGNALPINKIYPAGSFPVLPEAPPQNQPEIYKSP
ncbi:MAG: ATP-binding protein [bacterium]